MSFIVSEETIFKFFVKLLWSVITVGCCAFSAVGDLDGDFFGEAFFVFEVDLYR